MNREQIKGIIPHREPMLLVDELELDGEVSVGKYFVRGDEFFLQGHFPGAPVVPGVILCEMMAQTSSLLFVKEGEHFTPFFTGLNNVKFKNKVFPGSFIVFRCEATKRKGDFCFAKGTGTVDGKVCVSGEFSFFLTKGE